MSSLAPPRTADVDPDNPRNPGSLGHPYGCNPCNKYRPERPNDSCEHAATCSFCHGKEHERPRHRGQRGRHALQRRQFLESRNELNKEIVEIIDRIYEEPRDTTADLKRQLSDQFTPGSDGWEREVAMIVKKIGKIEDFAQNRRPDNARNRRARAEQLPELSQVDLEGRRDCYAATLHGMVKRMWDENRPEKEKLEEIHKIVDESLGEFKALGDDLARLEAKVRAAAQDHTWLVEPLKELVEKEAQEQSSQITDILNQPVWIELKLELLRLRKAAVLTGEQKAMRSASSLDELHELVKQKVDEDKCHVLAALGDDLARLEAQVKAAAQDHTWLVEPLKELVEKEAQEQSSQITDFLKQPVWIELKLEPLHLRKAAVLAGEQKAMRSASSLDELHELVKQKVDEDKFHVLAALEEDEEDLAK